MERVLTECWPVDERTRRALGIEPGWLGRLPGGLSGGELQRFCIARALHPQLRHLVADEMTTMLDPITQALIRSRLVGLIRERGIGLLVITHNPALAGRPCDDIVRLERINHLDPDESRPRRVPTLTARAGAPSREAPARAYHQRRGPAPRPRATRRPRTSAPRGSRRELALLAARVYS